MSDFPVENAGVSGIPKRDFTHDDPAFCPISLRRRIRRRSDGFSNTNIIKELRILISRFEIGLAHALIISLGTFSKATGASGSFPDRPAN